MTGQTVLYKARTNLLDLDGADDFSCWQNPSHSGARITTSFPSLSKNATLQEWHLWTLRKTPRTAFLIDYFTSLSSFHVSVKISVNVGLQSFMFFSPESSINGLPDLLWPSLEYCVSDIQVYSCCFFVFFNGMKAHFTQVTPCLCCIPACQ